MAMTGAVERGADDATRLGVRMLEWLSLDEQRLLQFMALSGCDAQTLMAEMNNPALHMAVLDYLMTDEALLLQFCADTNTAPEECSKAWQRLHAVDGAGGL